MPVTGVVVPVAVGAALWTLAEYLLHRFDMHSRAGRGETARAHRAHHRTLEVPALTLGTWVGAGLVALAFAAGGEPLVAVGWMVAYVGYELTHRLIHVDGRPAGPYRRWVRAHHLHHHLVDARSNYGVTSPAWDVVFRTYRRPRAGAGAAGETEAGKGEAGGPGAHARWRRGR